MTTEPRCQTHPDFDCRGTLFNCEPECGCALAQAGDQTIPCDCPTPAQMGLSPDICVNRHGGNPESTAANPPSEAKTLLRVQVESFIRSKGLQGATSDEIEASTGLPHQTISPRLTELKSRGYVVPGERRVTRSGKYARALVHIDWSEA